jgi:hypothetical protein
MSNAGHSVQNCTDKNVHIKGMNINDLIADIKSAAQKIRTLTGKEPTLFRAPYGDYDDKAITTIEGMGYIPVQWDVDSKDLDDPDAVSVRKRISDGAVSGSILLFHNDCAVTAEALPQIITELKQKGYELAKAEDVVFTSNYIIDDNGVQQYRPSVSAALPRAAYPPVPATTWQSLSLPSGRPLHLPGKRANPRPDSRGCLCGRHFSATRRKTESVTISGKLTPRSQSVSRPRPAW